MIYNYYEIVGIHREQLSFQTMINDTRNLLQENDIIIAIEVFQYCFTSNLLLKKEIIY
jgi:hypothetical protein